MKKNILVAGFDSLNFCEVHLQPEKGKAHLNMKTWLFDSENMKMLHACLIVRMKSERQQNSMTPGLIVIFMEDQTLRTC